MNYEDFPPWPVRIGMIPSPVWALWIVPSASSRWFFPWPQVISSLAWTQLKTWWGPFADISGVLSLCISLFFGILPCEHWLSWLFKTTSSVPSTLWEEVIERTWLPVDLQAGPRQSEMPHPLPCPWNVWSMHWSCARSHFKDAVLGEPCVVETWDNLDHVVTLRPF